MAFIFAGQYGPEVLLATAPSGFQVTLPSLSVNVYQVGTTTAVTLYTSRTKGTTRANPVPTDVKGNLTFFADPGQYDIVFTPPGGSQQRITVEVGLDPSEVSAAYVQPQSGFLNGPTPLYYVNVLDYGVVGNGSTDDTSAFESARAAAQSKGRPLLIPPGLTIKVAEIVPLWNGARVYGYGSTLDIQTDHTAAGRYLGMDNVSDILVRDLKLTQSNGSGRNGVQGMVTILSGGDIWLENLIIDGGESCGIFTTTHSVSTASGVANLHIVGCRIANTYADGIHISRGAQDVWIERPFVTASGDDAIAINSVTTDDGTHNYNQITRVHVIAPTVRNVTSGSAVGFYGCKNSTLVGGSADTIGHQGFYAASQSGGNGLTTPATANCAATGFVVTGANEGFLIGGSTDVSLSNCIATGCTDCGLQLISATRPHVVGGKYVNNAAFGVFGSGNTSANVMVADLHGNTTAATGGSTVTYTSCITV